MDLLFGPILLQQDQEVPTKEALKEAAVVAVYFGAHWAPPSRLFTERLIKFHNAIGLPQFKIVFVSDDGNFNAFMKNFALMPWLALPF
jgi:nucleoredoxin